MLYFFYLTSRETHMRHTCDTMSIAGPVIRSLYSLRFKLNNISTFKFEIVPQIHNLIYVYKWVYTKLSKDRATAYQCGRVKYMSKTMTIAVFVELSWSCIHPPSKSVNHYTSFSSQRHLYTPAWGATTSLCFGIAKPC